MAGLHDLHTLTLTWIHLDDCFVNRKLTHALSHQKHRETSVQKWLGRSNSIPLLVVSTPLKNLKVSWGYYSQYMEKKKHVPNHQPESIYPRLMLAMWLYPPEGADGIAATSARRSGPWSGDGEIWSKVYNWYSWGKLS